MNQNLSRVARQLLTPSQIELLSRLRSAASRPHIHDWALQTAIAGRLADSANRRIIHCFGDSHVQAFREVSNKDLMRKTWITVTAVDGGTALGLANPNSRSAALPTFLGTIDRLPKHQALLFMLGEVDCGYLIWYRAQKLGISVDEQVRESLSSYATFLRHVEGKGHADIVIAAVPPPTILDGQTWGAVAIARGNARLEVSATLEERTSLTRRYNAMLRSWSRSRGHRFLDYEPDVLDLQTLLVRPELRNRNPEDHHLESEVFAPILKAALNRIGFE